MNVTESCLPNKTDITTAKELPLDKQQEILITTARKLPVGRFKSFDASVGLPVAGSLTILCASATILK